MTFHVASARSAILAGLPTRSRWQVGHSPLDFDFSRAAQGLREIDGGDVHGGIDATWRGLLVFGASDYSEGGGASSWLVVSELDGTVYRLDVEHEPALTAYNSTLERFIRCYHLLDQYLGRGRPLPPGIALETGAIDPDCYPGSEWRALIEYLTSGD